MTQFMIDIETMGVDFKADDIIQIGILEVTKNADGYHVPGRSFMRTLHTEQKPKNDWIATNHKDLLPICYKTEYASPVEIRAHILSFFQKCGVNTRAQLMGLNAATFDIPYLVEKKYLVPPGSDDAAIANGDYHYRIYELRGAISVASDVLKLDDKNLLRSATNYAPNLFELPAGKKHEALYDCYKQLQTLNGLIYLLRNPGVLK